MATGWLASDTVLAGSVGVDHGDDIIHWLLTRRDGASARTADIETIRFPLSAAVKPQRPGFLSPTLPQLNFGPR